MGDGVKLTMKMKMKTTMMNVYTQALFYLFQVFVKGTAERGQTLRVLRCQIDLPNGGYATVQTVGISDKGGGGVMTGTIMYPSCVKDS